jgi:hypothetical protein
MHAALDENFEALMVQQHSPAVSDNRSVKQEFVKLPCILSDPWKQVVIIAALVNVMLEKKD